MTGYTKLFGSIIASTIWREDDKTRIVWITMLAMAGKTGIVEASVPGLADMARVTVDEARAAVQKLESPDPDSRSRDEEGRRILPIDGGWLLVNHAKYRAKMGSEERTEYLRIKQRESRERKALSTHVNTCQQSVDKYTKSTQAEAEAEAEKLSSTNPEASIPTWPEVKARAEMRGVPENIARKLFDHYQGKSLWLNQHGRLINWDYELTVWKGRESTQKIGAHNPKEPAWAQIKAIETRIKTHPANPESKNHTSGQTSDDQRAELKALRTRLADLRSQTATVEESNEN